MKVPCGLLVLLLTGICIAQPDPVAELQHRADGAKGVDCSRLSIQVARQSLEMANRQFGTGEVKAAHTEVDRSLRYATRAVDCTLQARKGDKAAEIDLRRLIRRMKDILQTLDSEDHPHVAQSLTELEEQRDRLLRSIFGSAAEHSGEKKP